MFHSGTLGLVTTYRMHGECLKGILHNTAVVYIDDIIVLGRDFSEHWPFLELIMN